MTQGLNQRGHVNGGGSLGLGSHDGNGGRGRWGDGRRLLLCCCGLGGNGAVPADRLLFKHGWTPWSVTDETISDVRAVSSRWGLQHQGKRRSIAFQGGAQKA